MPIGRYHAAETSYKEGDAEYDASEFNYQIVDDSDDVIALFPNEAERDHVLALLLNNPFPE